MRMHLPKLDSNLLDTFKKLDPQERYKLLKREERLRSSGVPLTLYFQQILREERQQLMSSKKRNKSGSGLHGVDKSFTLKKIQPKTPNQQETVDAYQEGYHLLLHGVAGTGKTFLSLWLGLTDVMAGKYEKVIIIRSVVPSRDMGFLPGTAQEKSAVYELPYQAICTELFGRGDAYNTLKTREVIQFLTTSHIRGTTIHDAVVIVDELQNLNFEELDTVITRIGENCKVILSGDVEQTDLYRSKYDVSGLPDFMDIIYAMDSFEIIEFEEEDIVRSGLVKDYIIAKRRFEQENEDGR